MPAGGCRACAPRRSWRWPPVKAAEEDVMEDLVAMVERLMREYEDSLPLARIDDEIMDVLLAGGLRPGDRVPLYLVDDVEKRLAWVSLREGQHAPTARVPYQNRQYAVHGEADSDPG